MDETSSLRALVQRLEAELKEAEKGLADALELAKQLERDIFNTRLDRDAAQKRVNDLESRLCQ